MSDEVKCPHCNTTMVPKMAERGPTAKIPRCTACNELIRPVAVHTPEIAQSPEAPQPNGESLMPPTNPNEPPELETTEPRPPRMPEQAVREPQISPPPTLELAEPGPRQQDVDRPWTQEERDWYEISRRVKRTGQFCKGISENEKRRATDLMAKYGTKPEEGWAKMPFVPRLLNVSHAANQKHLFEKPIKMVQVVDK